MLTRHIKTGVAILLFSFCSLHSWAQEAHEEENIITRAVHFFQKDNYVIAPIVSYLPETSWKFGLGVKYLFRPANYDSSNTRKSYVAAAIQYSLKNQFVAQPYFTYFFNEEKYVLDGKYSFRKFPLYYYGIGNNTVEDNKELFRFKEIKAEQIVFRKIKGKLFAGGGLRFIGYYDIISEPNGLLYSESPVGFRGFQSFGPSVNIRFDNRDNILNPHKGAFLESRLELMGRPASDLKGYNILKIDLRKYIKPFQAREDILAGQIYSHTTLSGDVPFPELAFVGSDVIMRGYYARRFIDRNFLGGQVEYRIPLPHKFGIVGFAGVGDVVNSIDDFSLSNIKYSVGAGVRYKIIPKEDINIRLDYGFGRGSHTFYLNIAEAF